MIIVNFKEQETNASKSGLWQWDYGQVLRIQGLKLPSAVEIHFSLQESGGEAVTRIGVTKDDATDVVIPDSMLENESTQGGTYSIYVFIYLTDETSGETEYKIKLLVSTRPRPEGRTESDKTTMAEILKVVNEIADSKEVSDEKIAEAVSNYLTVNPMEEKDPTVHDWAKQPEKPTYTASEVGADTSGTAESKVSEHNVATDAHNDIRLLIEGLSTRLNALADSDDTTLDQMSEVVTYIKSNKSLIDAITTSKVNVSDIIDNLTTNVSNKPLSAAQGVALKALIDAIVVPSKTSDLQNDSGFISSPATAEVGQVLEVEAIDGTGKPIAYKTVNMPESLPNPHALTFTGAVSESYNGSEAKTIEIPNVSGGDSGITFKGELIATLQGDNVSSEISKTLGYDVLTDGLYYVTAKYGSNVESNYSDIEEGTSVNENLYVRIGGKGIFGKGVRFLYHVGNTTSGMGGSSYVCICNGKIFFSTYGGISMFIGEPSDLTDYSISLYTQNGTVLTSDNIVNFYRIL